MKQLFNPEIWTVKRKKFNPLQWLSKPKVRIFAQSAVKNGYGLSKLAEVEIVVQRVEVAQIDLTRDYRDWLKLGFAFSSEFNEIGREFFHRISRFHAEYDFVECDRQYTKCLKSGKSGITIKSFFAAAYNAGINVKV